MLTEEERTEYEKNIYESGLKVGKNCIDKDELIGLMVRFIDGVFDGRDEGRSTLAVLGEKIEKNLRDPILPKKLKFLSFRSAQKARKEKDEESKIKEEEKRASLKKDIKIISSLASTFEEKDTQQPTDIIKTPKVSISAGKSANTTISSKDPLSLKTITVTDQAFDRMFAEKKIELPKPPVQKTRTVTKTRERVVSRRRIVKGGVSLPLPPDDEEPIPR